jgi:hypothetical protein
MQRGSDLVIKFSNYCLVLKYEATGVLKGYFFTMQRGSDLVIKFSNYCLV